MSDNETDAQYGLVVSFSGLYSTIEEERAFVNGYEAGEVGTMLDPQNPNMVVERTVHTANEGVLRRMAKAFGWGVVFTPTEPPTKGWSVATFSRLDVAMRRAHLSVVH